MKPLVRLFFLTIVMAMSAASLFSQGYVNRAIYFNGTNSRLQTPNGTTGYNPSQITIEAWISPTRNGGVIAEDSYTDNMSIGWVLYLDDATNKVIMRGSAAYCCADNCTSAAAVPLNAWTHVAGTFDGTSLRVYINGVLQNTVAAGFSALGSNNEVLSVGALNYDGVSTSRYFQGWMDEIRIWNVTRNATSIAANYQKWLTGAESNLVMYFHCDEPSGDWVYNVGGLESSNSYNLWVPYTGTVAHAAAALPGFPSIPADTSLSLWSGNIGTSVRINGLNFAPSPGNNSVFFGGVKAAAPTAGNSTYLDVNVPPGATFAPISVNAGGLIASSPRPFTPTYNGLGQIVSTSFELQHTVNTTATPQRITLWDIDGDGKLDVCVSSATVIQIFRNISTSEDLLLAGPVTLSLSTSSVLAYGDMDGDGKTDILCEPTGLSATRPVYRNTSTPGSISFVLGDAHGMLYATSSVLDDFDGDGKPDKISSSSYQGTQGAMDNFRNVSSAGTIDFFGTTRKEVTHPTHLASGDITGDSKPDVVATCPSCDAVSIMRNGGTMGTVKLDSTWIIAMPGGSSPKSTVIADFNNDGKLDIAVLCPGTNEVRLLRNTTSGNTPTFVQTSLTGLSGLTDIALGDADGDGRVDLFVTRNNAPAMAFRNTSSGASLTFATGIALETSTNETSAALGDLNNDGAPDLLVINPNATLSVMRNTPLATPKNLEGSSDNDKTITVSWDDRAVGETGYEIFRNGVKISSSLGANAAQYEDQSTSLRQGRIYKYGVDAVNSTVGIGSDSATGYGRLQFNGSVSGKVQTPRGAGVSGARVYLSSSTPNRYKALSFDGVDDYVQVPLDVVGTNPLKSPFPAMSMTAWIYPTQYVSGSYGPTVLSTTESSGWALRLNNGYIMGDLRGVGTVTFSGQRVPLNQWSHVAVTYDGSAIRGYLNGNQIGAYSGSGSVIATLSACLFIGGEPIGGCSFDPNPEYRWYGLIDEVTIWNVGLDAPSVKKYMSQYAAGHGVEPGLVAYWRFDEGTGTTTADNGAYSNYYGFLQNGPTWSNNASPVRRSAVTDSHGNYVIDQVDYGDTTTSYYLRASRDTDGVIPDSLTLQYSRNLYTITAPDLTDTSTFSLSGTIYVKGYPALGLKGVKLLIDGVPIDSTGSGGVFTVGMTGDLHTIKPVWHGHKFSPDSLRVSILNDTSGVIFQDITRDTIRGTVAAGLCKYPMGAATIHILDTFSGAFDSTITTNASGQFSVRVPAVSYFVKVDGLDSFDEDALNYFQALHSDVSLVEQDPVTIALDTASYPPGVDRKDVEMIYRTKPILSIQGIPLAGNCPTIVVPQGRRMPIRIKVTEKYGNRVPCVTSSGEVLISDNVSDVQGVIHSPIQGGLATYTIVAGEPNVLDGSEHPFQKLFEVRSTQPGGEAVEDFWMLVTGAHTAGNTFTAVTPQLPFLILRDPPGDHSSSFFEKESTYCVDSHFSTKIGGNAEGWLSLRAGVGTGTKIPFGPNAGFYVDITAGTAAGRDNDSGTTLTTCFSSTQRWSTSSEETWNGQKGDLYALMSLTLVYGVSDVLAFDPATCRAVKSKQLSFENVAYNTSVITNDYEIRKFEIPHTKDLITYFESQGKADSAEIFRRTLRSWEAVLEKGARDVAEALPSGVPGQDTMAFFAGSDFDQTWHYETTASSYYDFDISIDSRLSVELGTIIDKDYAHIIGGANATFRWEVDTSRSITSASSKTFGYHFSDDDPGDKFLVSLKKGPTNDPMIFETRGGESQCPGEAGTIKREGVSITFDTPVIKGLPGNDTVLAYMQCGNLSGTSEEKQYNLRYLQAGQVGFPGILVDGARLDAATPLPVIIPAGTSKTMRVVVQKYPGEFNYEGIKMVLSSVCDPIQIADTAVFAVFFDNGQNAPPQVIRTESIVGKNVASGIELKAIDPEGQPLDYKILEQPHNGAFTVATPPTLTYRPNAGFTGTDFFQFNVSDGENVVAKRFKILVQNTAPVAVPSRVDTSMNQDTTLILHLAATDPDSDALKDTMVYIPKHGTVTGSSSNLVYRPNQGYVGPDDFTYGFDDGDIITRVRVNVDVKEVYKAPVPATVTAVLTGVEGSTTVNVVQGAISSNGRPLSVVEDKMPGPNGYGINNGDGTITYFDTTAAGLNVPANRKARMIAAPTRSDITYHITDGIQTTSAILTVDIDRANTRPVAGFGSALSFDGVNDGVNLPNISGFNPNAITIEYWFKGSYPQSIVRWQSDPGHYLVSGWNGMHLLSNDGGTSGIATGNISDGEWHHVAMTWQISTVGGFRSYIDGQLVQSRNSSGTPIPIATLDLSVFAFGYQSVSNSEFMNGSLDEMRIWNYARTDTQIQSGMYQRFSAGAPGLIASWNFDENAGTSVSAAGGPVEASGAMLNMTNPWHPAGIMQKVTVLEDDTAHVALRAYDADGDPLTYTIIAPPAHGKLVTVGATSTYVPNKDFTGYDYVTYTVSDGKSTSDAPATLSIYVQNVEDAPVAEAYTYSTPKNKSVGMRLVASDPDPGDVLQYTTYPPLHGTLSLVGSFPDEFTYTPTSGFAGVDSFVFYASDGINQNGAIITINVVNHRPVAADTLLAQPAGTAFHTVLFGNDEDLGDTLQYTVLKNTAHGSFATDSLPKAAYTPNPGYSGSDTLLYTVSDGVASDTGQVVFVVMTPTGVQTPKPQLPMTYKLYQNYPNPFNPVTQIEYDLAQQSRVVLKVYSILGQEVATLVDGVQQPAGKKVVSFNANQLASGVYFYRLEAGTFREVKKMVLIK